MVQVLANAKYLGMSSLAFQQFQRADMRIHQLSVHITCSKGSQESCLATVHFASLIIPQRCCCSSSQVKSLISNLTKGFYLPFCKITFISRMKLKNLCIISTHNIFSFLYSFFFQPPLQQISINELIKIPVTKAGNEKSNRSDMPIHITLKLPCLLGYKVKEALEGKKML